MKSPFSKLIRISVILFSVVLLFNFFGYYLSHSTSNENQELREAKGISQHQQTLSESITKNAALLISGALNSEQATICKDSLAKQLSLFKKNNEELRKQVDAAELPVPEPVLQIRLLFSTAQSYFQGIASISHELAITDSSLISLNRKLYLNQLLYNEQKFLPVIEQITEQYDVIAIQKSKEAFNIEIGKLISLVIAI